MVDSIPRILAMLYRMATQQPVGLSNSLSDIKGVNRFLLGWESQITTLKLNNIKPLGFSNAPLYRCALYDIGLFYLHLCMFIAIARQKNIFVFSFLLLVKDVPST